jgi:Zn-dependent M28 family amino/carboxypeptidase
MKFVSIRAVVNVDSCGTTGREILFQANSREMIDAYKQAPYPHGTVMVYLFGCTRMRLESL